MALDKIYKQGAAKELWEFWNVSERAHFLIDHYDMYSTELESDVTKYAQKFSHSEWKNLPMPIKKQIAIHHAMGAYGAPEPVKSPTKMSKTPYLTPKKKELLSKLTAIKEKMDNVKDEKVLASLNQQIQEMEATLSIKTPTDTKIQNWKQEKAKRLSRSK